MNLQTLISNDRLANLVSYAERARTLEGDFAEFGVFRGGSLELIAKLHRERRIIGIDSFEGLPKPGDRDNFHKKGDFKETNYSDVKGYFRLMYPNVEIIKGFSPFDKLDPGKKYAFVHIDVDLYQSVWEGLDFFYPRMVEGGIIILDDYGFESTEGAKKATDEFCAGIKTFHAELKYADGLSFKQYVIIC